MSPAEKARITRARNRRRRLAQLEQAMAAAGHDVDTAARLGNERLLARTRSSLRRISAERHRLRWTR